MALLVKKSEQQRICLSGFCNANFPAINAVPQICVNTEFNCVTDLLATTNILFVRDGFNTPCLSSKTKVLSKPTSQKTLFALESNKSANRDFATHALRLRQKNSRHGIQRIHLNSYTNKRNCSLGCCTNQFVNTGMPIM